MCQWGMLGRFLPYIYSCSFISLTPNLLSFSAIMPTRHNLCQEKSWMETVGLTNEDTGHTSTNQLWGLTAPDLLYLRYFCPSSLSVYWNLCPKGFFSTPDCLPMPSAYKDCVFIPHKSIYTCSEGLHCLGIYSVDSDSEPYWTSQWSRTTEVLPWHPVILWWA